MMRARSICRRLIRMEQAPRCSLIRPCHYRSEEHDPIDAVAIMPPLHIVADDDGGRCIAPTIALLRESGQNNEEGRQDGLNESRYRHSSLDIWDWWCSPHLPYMSCCRKWPSHSSPESSPSRWRYIRGCRF